MTWITDDGGTRWVEVPQKKRRSSPRARKFAEIKIGDQLMLKPAGTWYRKVAMYYVVTDLWFDPVLGQDDALKGSMVGYQQIAQTGEPRHRKSSTTIRGLASQQFDYADIDYIAHCKATLAAMQAGEVIGIGRGRAIRARPKISGL